MTRKPYDPLKDLAPITLTAESVSALMVHSSLLSFTCCGYSFVAVAIGDENVAIRCADDVGWLIE
jgi:hypothetical protein